MTIASYLELSMNLGASDLHLSPGLSPICRVNGELVTLSDIPPLDANATKTAISGLITKEQQDILTKHLQLDFSISMDNLGMFRVNAFYQSIGLAAVFRILPSTAPTMEELGLPLILHKLLNLGSGLILVTGPTGCGKSASLAAMVNHINMNYSRHIITIEDPIEFTHRSMNSLINQRQLFRDATSYSEALRAALREDPDVILIGEMRDLETIRLALTAAETGHLVLATLHTSTAPRAVNRIIDVFPATEKKYDSKFII